VEETLTEREVHEARTDSAAALGWHSSLRLGGTRTTVVRFTTRRCTQNLLLLRDVSPAHVVDVYALIASTIVSLSLLLAIAAHRLRRDNRDIVLQVAGTHRGRHHHTPLRALAFAAYELRICCSLGDQASMLSHHLFTAPVGEFGCLHDVPPYDAPPVVYFPRFGHTHISLFV
jgi:hypothetical protein